jgi:hypothetical protein
MRRPLFVLPPLLLVVAAGNAGAQGARFSLAIKGGLSVERSEDNLNGTAPAVGVTGMIGFRPLWRGEVEFWLPGYLDDERGEPKHRDIFFSFSAVRIFDSGRIRPFVLAGLSITRTQDRFTFCTAERPIGPGGAPGPAIVSCDEPDVVDVRRERNDGTDGYLLAGGGVEIPITDRLGLIADVRLSLAPASVIVRPGAGAVFSLW